MRTTRLPALLALLALAGCDPSGPDIGPPAAMDRGAIPTDLVVGQTLADLTVTVRDSEGRTIEGEAVTWTPSAGSVVPAGSRTDGQGRASTTWTLGTTAGDQTLTARAGDASVVFRARVGAGPLAGIVLDPPAPRLESVGDTLLVTAAGVDAYDNPVPLPSPVWTSSDPAVASVVAGRVISHGEGSATIGVAAGGVTGEATVVVDQVVVALGIQVDDPVMLVGESQPLDARPVDAKGTPVDTALAVQWASADPSVATVDADGVLQALAEGVVVVSATAPGLSGDTTIDVRAGTRPSIATITPAVLAAGDTATIDGDGFAPSVADNAVTIAGIAADVIEASATRLTVRLPAAGTFPCGPTGDREVVVDANGLTARAMHPVSGAVRHALETGESVALLGDGAACAELANPGSYVLSVFNASPAYTSETAFLLRGTGPVTPALAADRVRPRLEITSVLPPADADAEAEAHAFLLEESRRIAETLGAHRPDPRRPDGLAAAQKGDLATFRIPNIDTDGSTCSDFILVTARAVHVGERAVVWEDTLAPLAGTMDEAWATIGTEYDQVMHPILLEYFGDPLIYQATLDDDGRIAMLFSETVNTFERGVAGFVWSGDFVSRGSCLASDQREVFYGRVPTTPGAGYESGTVDNWRWRMRATVIHEAKHLTAYATKFALSTGNVNFEDTGLEEATARLSEELYGRALQGYGQGDNVGYLESIWCERRVGTNHPDCDPIPLIMGKHYSGVNSYFKAPALLSPLGPSSADGSSYYGSGWQLVRWAVDHSGRPEAEFIRSIIEETSLRGPANLADKVGRPLAGILADYSLAIAVDDHPSGFTPARPELTLPGWDTRDIFTGLHEDYAGTSVADVYPTPWPLETAELVPGDFEASVPVITGGGAAIFELNGLPGPQLLELLSESGGTAPGTLGLAIVRVQ